MILTRRAALTGFAAAAFPAAALAKSAPDKNSFSTPAAIENHRAAQAPEERAAYHLRAAATAMEEIACGGYRFWSLNAVGKTNKPSRGTVVYWDIINPEARGGDGYVQTELSRWPI